MKKLASLSVAILLSHYAMIVTPDPSRPTVRVTPKELTGTRKLSSKPTVVSDTDSNRSKRRALINKLTGFRKYFSNFEVEVTAFLESADEILRTLNSDRVNYLSVMSDYLKYLPNTERKPTRSTCFCEGSFQTPCPERCLNSCYISICGRHYDDCTVEVCSMESFFYYCYDGSPKMRSTNIKTCYDPPKPCSNFTVDRSNLEMIFHQLLRQLMEPLNVKIGRVKYQLKFARQTIYSSEILANVTWQQCENPNNEICLHGSMDLLLTKLAVFENYVKNITLECFDCQLKIEQTAENAQTLKETIFRQINRLLKAYTSCLKVNNVLVDIDSRDLAILEMVTKKPEMATKKPETTTKKPETTTKKLETVTKKLVTTTMKSASASKNSRPTINFKEVELIFLCKDRSAVISSRSRCDGKFDCSDFSDELYCGSDTTTISL